MLKESEWNTINNILLDLYTISDIKQLSGRVLRVLQLAVPFSKGYFVLFDEQGKIDEEDSSFIGFDEITKDRYMEKYYLSSSENEIKGNTNQGIGLALFDEGKIRGVLSLTESAAGDFSPKSEYILNIFKRHLENIVHNAYLLSSRDYGFMSSKCFDNAVNDYALSHREAEILKLIADGKSNAEICTGLCVSISTVKKHVYNIFNKAGVNSRTQLLNQIYRMRRGS